MDMDADSIDFNQELDQMGKSINYYKSKLQSCRDKYESVEMKICDVRGLQREAILLLNNVQTEEQYLKQRLENIHLDYETCIEKLGDHEDMDETIRAKIKELTTQRSALMKELEQLKKNVDENGRKLTQANAMITEQEEKNASLLQELKNKSEEITSAPEDIRKRIDDVLKHLNKDDAIGSMMG